MEDLWVFWFCPSGDTGYSLLSPFNKCFIITGNYKLQVKYSKIYFKYEIMKVTILVMKNYIVSLVAILDWCKFNKFLDLRCGCTFCMLLLNPLRYAKPSNTAHTWTRTQMFTNQNTNIAHCCLSSVIRQELIMLRNKLWKSGWNKVVSSRASLTRARIKTILICDGWTTNWLDRHKTNDDFLVKYQVMTEW